MKILKTFNKFNENIKSTLTLYHGTCEQNSKKLIENGWEPINTYGSNMGNPNYLYLSSDPEDALWFAEEKGCNTIIKINNIPIEYLRPDPEDEAGFTMKDLLKTMDNNLLPAKFILTKSLNNKHFELYKNSI